MAMTRAGRTAALLELFSRRVVLLDGAMGTFLEGMALSAADFGGQKFEGCPEALILHRPSVISEAHAAYLEAGADIIETATFGATPLVLQEYGLETRAEEINRLGAMAARHQAELFSETGKMRFVAGSMGPTTTALSLRSGTLRAGELDFEELAFGHYLPQARGLYAGGADYFLIETCQDALNLKAALSAIEALFDEVQERIPVAVSATLSETGHMLSGMSAEALGRALEGFDLLYLGLNCGEGPRILGSQLRRLASASNKRLALMPNAGRPGADGRYELSPEEFSEQVLETCADCPLSAVGGCCGTTPAHIRALAKALPGLSAMKISAAVPQKTEPRSFLTGMEVLEVGAGTGPVIAGERSNALGSKKFREFLSSDDFESAADFARRQLDEGASLLDVAVQQTNRDEKSDMVRLVRALSPIIRAPLMIDTTHPDVALAALRQIQGKAIVNSANLESGEERFLQMARTARRMGAALVVGLIDEKGMAVRLGDKLRIAKRALGLLEGTDFELRDIYLDALVFPCASGDPAYLGAADETVRAIRSLKAAFPGVRTALGISNVSFGLPPGIRPVVTRRFFELCADAGLDLAIANAAAIEKTRAEIASGKIPAELIEAAERLLGIEALPMGADETARTEAEVRWQALIAGAAEAGRAFTAARSQQGTSTPKPSQTGTLTSPESTIADCILRGTKAGLISALTDELKAGRTAREILDEVLMRAMDEVGGRFGRGELIVPEVLSSAEVMRRAIEFLSPSLASDGGSGSAARGRFLIATVKGDVHDIGKNLVAMVFGSSGFEVTDLGTRVEDAAIVRAAKELRPDFIGLSGLLVRSAFQMADTVRALSQAGLKIPVLVGGAALSDEFARSHIAPAADGFPVLYTKDAMACLAAAKALQKERTASPAPQPAAVSDGRSADAPSAAISEKSDCTHCTESGLPDAAVEEIPLEVLMRLVNPAMLYGHHLGLTGTFLNRLDEFTDDELSRLSPRALELRRDVERALHLLRERGISPASVRRVISARRMRKEDDSGSSLVELLPPGKSPIRLAFPRIDGFSLADLVSPTGTDIGLFAATSGAGVSELVRPLMDSGELRLAHVVQALCLSLAEAAAEWTHALLRRDLALADLPAVSELTPALRRAWLKNSYPGRRASPGYRLCPDLGLQRVLFALLAPGRIGITLTETLMMSPEASVSALVFP